MRDDFTYLEDYGLIGNQETCALIAKAGSVDWLATPYLDSASVLAGVLDPWRGGIFSVAPRLKYQAIQRYLDYTNVLVTEFSTATGVASVTDFMPPLEGGGEHRMLLRKLEGKRHDCALEVSFRPRFDYGRLDAEVRKEGDLAIASGNGVSLAVWGGNLTPGDGEATGTIELHEGESAWMALAWCDNPKPLPAEECERLLQSTIEFWLAWSHQHDRSESVHRELHHDLAMRSGLALKLLLNPLTGGIAAAATLSLPESIGGIRNWDYRFAWIRDASFTAQALFHLGYGKEATEYRKWVLDILRQVRDPSELKPLYPLHAEAKKEEGLVDALCGYRWSGPVRVGNLAAQQVQMDIYGEFVNTVFETSRFGEDVEPQVWDVVRQICDFVSENWGREDRGMWEMRSDPRHYVHSKLMCWVALDRGMQIARLHNFDAPVGRWKSAAQEIHGAILDRGFSKRLKSFVQCFDSEKLDATALLIPIHRFLPPEDPRVQSTIDVVWRGLSAGNGLLYRYNTDDGLAGKEGAFVLCSFWLVNALSLSRRIREAETVFRQMLRHVSPLGLLSEEVDPRDGRMIGNLPQALSHIGFINAALHLGIAKGGGYQGPPPQSEETTT